jgi:F1F0 ATPase subunit 2
MIAMTNPQWEIPLSLVTGIALGILFFGGLRWTVIRLPMARRPLLLLLGSFAVRVPAVGLGMVLASGGDWIRLLAVLAGFLGVRVVTVRLWGPARGATAIQREGGRR